MQPREQPEARLEPRPCKRRRGLSKVEDDRGATIQAHGNVEDRVIQVDVSEGTGGGEDGDASSAGRACENCRRSKLRCTRTQPCTKCLLKRVVCVYEEPDKKRGPRPGYIEELNSRMDTLEKLVLGQSLLLQGAAGDVRRLADTTTLHATLQHERARLLELAESGSPQPWDKSPLSSQELQREADGQGQVSSFLPSMVQMPDAMKGGAFGTAPVAGSIESGPTRSFVALGDVVPASPLQDVIQQASDFYEQHLQPWLPIMPWVETTPRLACYDPFKPLDPWMQAVLAAVAPHTPATAPQQLRYFEELRLSGTQGLLQSANMDQLRVSLLLHFVLFGNGRATEAWGIGVYMAQVVIRAGLHVEDHHVTREQQAYRRLLMFDGRSQSWADKESVRRVFWAVFLLDRFASLYAGVPPCLDAKEVRRLLPCPGRFWQRGEPVHTRDFVPASIAVQVQQFSDLNLGGYAYLIEATEILTTVTSFAARHRALGGGGSARPDVRAFLKEFLELDFILTNWKSKLPPRYHHVSYDENGYMDHNVTLAHMTHNTSSIMLYQSPRTLFGLGPSGEELHRTLLPQCAIIKHGAKEIARICTRFLFHRRYLVSPQFAYCQFAAARSLLAYASWTAEPVDDEFEILFTALAESAKRWAGVGHGHEGSAEVPVAGLDNLAAMLHSRLEYDMKSPGLIDLAVPVEQLLREAGIGPGSLDVAVTEGNGASPTVSRYCLGIPSLSAPEMEKPAARDLVQGLVEQHLQMGSSDRLDDVLAQMALSQPEALDARLFSWEREPELAET